MQTYEIYLPASLREDYDSVYRQRLSITKLQDRAAKEQQKEEQEQKKQQKQHQDKSSGVYSNVPNREVESSKEQEKQKKGANKKVLSVNLQNEREKLIKENEIKRHHLSQALQKKISTVYLEDAAYIIERGICERLFKTLPDKVKLQQDKQYKKLLERRQDAMRNQQQIPPKQQPPAQASSGIQRPGQD